MKRLIQYVFLLALIGTPAYFIYERTVRPCDETLEYSIGRFDSQFGLSMEDFKSYVLESGLVWEKILDKKVFIYNPNADFKINLVYDERQLATVQKQKTEFGLSAVENVFKKLDADFIIFKSQYDNKVSTYETALSAYKRRKDAYDKKVAYWNSRGGALKDEFQSLEAERIYLNTEARKLNTEVSSINDMTRQLDTLLKERNLKAVEYNKIAADYNKKYNNGLEFNQAEYKSGNPPVQAGEINVYQFGNKKDLILALSHEFGHALGMGHVENPKSIMYYITGANTETSPAPTTEDLIELNKVCKK